MSAGVSAEAWSPWESSPCLPWHWSVAQQGHWRALVQSRTMLCSRSPASCAHFCQQGLPSMDGLLGGRAGSTHGAGGSSRVLSESQLRRPGGQDTGLLPPSCSLARPPMASPRAHPTELQAFPWSHLLTTEMIWPAAAPSQYLRTACLCVHACSYFHSFDVLSGLLTQAVGTGLQDQEVTPHGS